jgi:hypothetical protein
LTGRWHPSYSCSLRWAAYVESWNAVPLHIEHDTAVLRSVLKVLLEEEPPLWGLTIYEGSADSTDKCLRTTNSR